MFFEIFSKIFRKFYEFFLKIWISQPYSWVLSEYSQILRVLPPNMIAQFLVVFEIWRFLWFFQKFSESSNLLFFKIWNSQRYSSVLSEYTKELQILPPNMTVQILVLFEIWRFLRFFQKFSENFINCFSKFEFPSLIVGCCQSTLKYYESCLQIWLLNSL